MRKETIMKVRRVVTGHSEDGKSIIVSDTMVDGIELALAPGAIFHSLWGSDETPSYPDDGAKPTYHTWFAPIGGFRFTLNTLPPDVPPPDIRTISPADIEATMAAGLAEAEIKMPGLLATIEPDMSGFHRSDTIDLLYIISGEIVLDLDNGQMVVLKAGDSAIQNGTRHALRNLGNVPCILLAVTVGAHRKR